MLVTISDVAREAGVSLSTASRALNNSMLVSQEKKDRVAAAVKKLGYRPLRISPARRSQQNKIIMVVTASLNAATLDAIRRTADSMGYQTATTFVGETQEDGYRSALELIRLLPAGLLCGIIFIHNECRDEGMWREFCQYPIVQIGEFRAMDPTVCVMIDDYSAAYDMTRFLIDRGYRRIAYVTSNDERQYSYCKLRKAGYEAALAAAGLPCEPALQMKADYILEGGIDVARQLAEQPVMPDAVFCSSDYMALGCISELQKLGYSVPKDVAVCGFDNIDATEYCLPRLTTINQPYSEMGEEAVRMLDALISGENTAGRKLILPHAVLARDST